MNNAGIAIHKALADFTDDDYDRIMNVNLKAVFTTMRATLKAMVAQSGGGSIVNTSSIAGVMGVQRIGLYAASKHGVMALTKNAAREYGKYGIRVNAILPNAIVTNLGAATGTDDFGQLLLSQVALGRPGQPSEVGPAVAFLLSDKASFISAASLEIDGGSQAGI